MTATLTFNLDDPDDRKAHLRCVKSTDMAIALFEIMNNSDINVRDIEHYKENIMQATAAINIDELLD